MTDVVSSPLQVDRQRRTTLPSDVMAAAGIPAGSALVARAQEPGRIVLESPALLLAALQEKIAAGRAEVIRRGSGTLDSSTGPSEPLTSMAEDLLAERAAEALAEDLETFKGSGDDLVDMPGAPDAKAGSSRGDTVRESRPSKRVPGGAA